MAYNKADSLKSSFISEEAADRFFENYIPYLLKYNITNAQIVFYGGEPLANFKLIKYIVLKFKEKYDFNFAIITNGTLITKDIISFIKSNPVDLAIALDDPEHITDENRKYIDNRNSVYRKVLENIEILKQNQIEFSLSMTITDYFLRNKHEVFDWLKGIGVRKIGHNLLKFDFSNIKDLKSYYSEAGDFVIETYEKFGKDNTILEDKAFWKMKALLHQEFTLNECAVALGEQITLNADGTVYTKLSYLRRGLS